MSEVEKMYRAAKVVPSHHYCNDCKYDMSAECPIRCPDDVAVYPPFTAEKQLNLVILLANREVRINPTYICSGYYLNDLNKIKSSRNVSTFENSLAQHINAIWQDLTEEEKQQIKEILG